MAQISRWLHVCWKKELHPIQSNTNCQTINDKAVVFRKRSFAVYVGGDMYGRLVPWYLQLSTTQTPAFFGKTECNTSRLGETRKEAC